MPPAGTANNPITFDSDSDDPAMAPPPLSDHDLPPTPAAPAGDTELADGPGFDSDSQELSLPASGDDHSDTASMSSERSSSPSYDEDELQREILEDLAPRPEVSTLHVTALKTTITADSCPELTIGLELTADQQGALFQLVNMHRDAFALVKTEMGRCDFVRHHIDVQGHAPIHKRPFRYSANEREVLQKEMTDMLNLGVIEPSQSPWGFPAILLPKKDGGIRVCIDFRDLNTVTKTDAYPLPRIDEMLDRLHGAMYFSKLDCKSAFWMIRMAPASKEIAAVITPFGKYHFKYMPIGLKNAPATFQQAIDSVLQDYPFAYPYLDDIIVFSSTWEAHHAALHDVFTTYCRQHQTQAL